jgi:hypothetical protein
VDTTLLLLTNFLKQDDILVELFIVNAIGFWTPLLNPIGSILTNKPYRQAVAALLCCRPCRKKNNATVGVAVAVVAPANK